MAGVQDRINELAREVALAHGLDVEEIKLLGRGKGMLLRITIDKPGGVTLNDCEVMSRDIEALLDLEDPIKAPYTLEVSSPGLDRPLRVPGDFRRHEGKLIRLVTRQKLGNQSFFIGRLVSVSNDGIVLLAGDRSIEISFDNIASARLEVEIK